MIVFVNLFFVALNAYMMGECRPHSFGWWFNFAAVALNFLAVTKVLVPIIQ